MNRPRTILVTGANTGIGAACAVSLARPGVHLVLACRSEARTEPVLGAIRDRGARATFVRLDLGDLAQASATGRALAEEPEPLDVLIDNAGLAGQRGLTKDGFELAFGTNHLGHFAFTLPLLPRLARARGRVVVVASGSHRGAKEIPWARLREPTASVSGFPEYRVSKLCNILFTAELRRRAPEITAVSMNPGRIATDIWRRVPQPFRTLLPALLAMKPVSHGGDALVHASEVDLEGEAAPLYLDKTREAAPSALCLREDLAAELWRYSEEAIAGALARPHRPASAADAADATDEGPAVGRAVA